MAYLSPYIGTTFYIINKINKTPEMTTFYVSQSHQQKKNLDDNRSSIFLFSQLHQSRQEDLQFYNIFKKSIKYSLYYLGSRKSYDVSNFMKMF